MRTMLAVFALLLTSSAYAGDLYAPPVADAYGPPAYGPPPYYPPAPHRRPPAIIVAPEGPAYLVPGPAYQATDEHLRTPLLVDGRRYYRACWWDFGATRCALKAKAWYW